MTSRSDRPEKGEGSPKGGLSRRKWMVVLAGQIAIVVALAVLVIPFHILSTTHTCPERGSYPTFYLALSSTPEGYEVEFTVVSEVHSLERYEVSVLKDGERWGGFPRPVENGPVGRGPAGEYLNFTDPADDGNLTAYDWFTLENLESGTEYELVLFWAECSKRLETVGISVP